MAVRRSENTDDRKVWTIAEAKAKLSEVLRLAESEGPQRIGTRKSFVVVPEEIWLKREEPERMPMGRWLLEKMPRGAYIEVPRDEGPERPIPYADWTEEEWAAFDATARDNE